MQELDPYTEEIFRKLLRDAAPEIRDHAGSHKRASSMMGRVHVTLPQPICDQLQANTEVTSHVVERALRVYFAIVRALETKKMWE